MPPDTEASILSRSPQKLTFEEIEEWYDAAYNTKDDASALFWLMPRILDLLAQGREICFFGNIGTFSRLKSSMLFPDWPKPYQEIFHEFAIAYLDCVIEGKFVEDDYLYDEGQFYTVFGMFSNAGLPMKTLLDHLDALPRVKLAQGILWQFASPYQTLPPKIESDNLWANPKDAEEVSAFLARREFYDDFLRLGMDANGEEQTVLLKAAELLELVISSKHP
ncbi:hypothetical protein [Celeribacter litoreus]|uniref:hypothetical protein n=1 Tax=Celeribacter litoreus TaxID=2876714 RepID=UPI001CCF347A|nr:hypothetical protein [Celeribacter litoreus]MCA0042385.1 hypothetical protein [Celeribacter litoreus]